MAKTRKLKHSNSNIRYRRDAIAIARPRTESLGMPESFTYTQRHFYDTYTQTPQLTTIIDDNRLFNPDPYRPPLNRSGNFSRIISPSGNAQQRRNSNRVSTNYLTPRLVIDEPKKVMLCLRRHRRKQVIHARGIAGSRVAKPKFNLNSQMKCR